MQKILIGSEKERIEISTESFDNPTAEKISLSLPLRSKVKTWGDEIYFDTNITAPVQDATLDVNIGDIAYWPDGKCLCIFFGRTPASHDEKPVPASEVVIVGRANVDRDLLRRVKPGTTIKVY